MLPFQNVMEQLHQKLQASRGAINAKGTYLGRNVCFGALPASAQIVLPKVAPSRHLGRSIGGARRPECSLSHLLPAGRRAKLPAIAHEHEGACAPPVVVARVNHLERACYLDRAQSRKI